MEPTVWVKTRVYIVENHEVRKVPLVLLTRCLAWDSDLMTSIMGPNDVNYGAISLIGVARGIEMSRP